MATKNKKEEGWQNSSDFEKNPFLDVKASVGLVTVGEYVSSKTIKPKGKKKSEMTFHTLLIDGVAHDILGTGLLNWFFREKVQPGYDVRLTYQGLQEPKKPAGVNNSHQFKMEFKAK